MNLAATSHPTAGAIALRATPGFISRRTLSLALSLLALALLTASSAFAWEQDAPTRQRTIWRGLDTWADGRLVDVQISVDGEPAPLFWAPNGNDRRYLQAFAGRNYSLLLRNNTGNRVAVLLAVDGLNAVNGEITRLQSHEPMYVLGPWEQATIRGWRTSLDEIRRFVFVDERRSYAERTGQANSDMGWIRVLSFREQQLWGGVKRLYGGGNRQWSGYRDGGPSSALPAPSEAPQAKSQETLDEMAPPPSAVPKDDGRKRAMAPDAQGNMARGEEERDGSFPGTGWGERRTDRVRQVRFTPESVATDKLIFRYEYASGLRALGIFPERYRERDRLHERDGDLGFAKPPRW